MGTFNCAFLYRSGEGWKTLTPKYGGNAAGLQINNAGQIMGACTDPNTGLTSLVVIWNPDGTITEVGDMAPQYQNFAFGLNNQGWVCGMTNGPWGNTGYVWSPESGFTPVFNPYDLYGYCAVNGMNDHNVAVGTMSISGQGWRGYVRAKDGTLTLLNPLLAPGSQGWVVTDCYDVNNLGQIAAVGEKNGQRYGVLLQPVPGGTLTFGGGW